MKLGIVADVHGNVEGLRIAIDMMGPVEELICAGDAVYQFRFSNETIALLRERDARYILGNHERVLLGPWGERVRASPSVQRDLLDYMAARPYSDETQVNGRKLVIVHGSPFDPHDEYLYPNSPGLQKLAQIDADYIVLGHTHYHMAERIGRALVVNPGSAGEPRDHRNGFRLSCAVLDTQSGEVTFHHYDDPTRPTVDPAIIPQPSSGANVLYYGDNLDVLRKHIPDESIDLIYLDPPFNSNRSYNVLFKESTGAGSEAQIEAFEDAWQWGPHAQEAYEEVITGSHQHVARMLRAMVEGLKHNDVTAYLTIMGIRLIELHRVLKDVGSIYLHCDPTAGPYLRVLMDAVFGAKNVRAQIAWRRFSSHGNVYKTYGRVQDTLLFYTKGEAWTWNQPYRPLSQKYVDDFFTHVEPGTNRRYRLQNVLNPNKDRPNLTYEWNGHIRVWKWTRKRMQELHDSGLLEYSKTGLLKGFKQYLDESEGEKLQDIWDDIRPLGQSGDVDLGYETQKPLALLERIISASSDPGDVVLDPFCGCGTAVHAAEKLRRRWIGIDITHLAIGLIRRRMQGAFKGIQIEVIGEPVDLAGARDLAARDKYQFQWWVLDRLGAQPVSGKKKGSDKGIDGVIPFFEGPKTDFKRVIVSVKGGEKVGVGAVRDLRGVIEREKEPIGVFVTLTKPTQDMITEAAKAGSYHNDLYKKSYPRLQILTVEQILKDKRPQMPPQHSPFAEAPTEREQAETPRLL